MDIIWITRNVKYLFMLTILTLEFLMVSVSAAGTDKSKNNARSYIIAQGGPFYPWDNPLPSDGSVSGDFSADILNAVCDANIHMDCQIVAKPYNECAFYDAAQPTGTGVGEALLSGEVIGCLSWSRTNLRLSRGMATTQPYSAASAPGTNDTLIVSANGLVNTNNSLAFGNGFAADLSCAQAAGYGQTVAEVSDDPVYLVDNDTDAIIIAGYGIPPGMQVAAIVESDGETPLNCLSGITVLMYPPSNPPDTNSFIKNFDCGLSLITESGKYQEICATYAPDNSYQPFCLNTSDIKRPSKSCKKKRNRNK